MTIQFFIDNIGNLAPYGILLLVYLFLSFLSEVQKNRFFAVPVLAVLLFFVGCRDAMTPDLKQYVRMYESVDTLNFVGVEPSFLLLSKSLSALGLDYHALFFAYSLITLAFIYLGIRNYTSHTKLSLLLFVLLPGFFLNMFVEMRQVCAVSIAFYATSLMHRKDKKPNIPAFLTFAALSVSFHYSAILCWAIYLVSYKFITKPHTRAFYLSLLAGTILIPTSVLIGAVDLFATPLLPAKFHGYINMFMNAQTDLAETGQLLKTLVYLGVAVCFVLWQSPMQNKDGDHVPLNLFVLGVVILNLTRSFSVASRLSFFFVIYQIVVFPTVLGKVKNEIGKFVAAYSVVLFYAAQFAWGLFYYPEDAGYYPFLHYQNVVFSILR